jgi:hypothetical protein
VALAAPVVAIGALIVLDLATGGGAHLTRSVVDSGGSGDLWDVLRRRLEGSVSGLRKPGQAVVFAIALAWVAWLAWRHQAVLARTARYPAFRAGLIGALFAVVIGAASNDSGPLILEIGAVLLGLAAGYANSPRPPAATARLKPCA